MSDENLELKVNDETVSIEPKKMYVLLENEDSDSGYAAINSYKDHLLITTLRPEILKEKGVNIEDLCKDDYIRVTQNNQKSDKYQTLTPQNIGVITSYVLGWVNKHEGKNSVVYIDKYAFQDMVNNNGDGLSSMRNLAKILASRIENTGASIIISIDPSAYEGKDHKPLIKQIISTAKETGGAKLDRSNIKF